MINIENKDYPQKKPRRRHSRSWGIQKRDKELNYVKT